MPGVTPLGEDWRLQGENLPERLIEEIESPGFTLPGAQELAAFADLLGLDDQEAAEDAPPASAPYRLHALLPQDMPGEAELTREIDLRLCGADWASVRFSHLTGRGRLLLDGSPAASFDHGPLEFNLTPQLSSSRTHTLTLRFDDVRPAGVSGPVTLHTASAARLDSIRLSLSEREAALRVRIHALKPGCYQLRVLPCPADGALAAAQPPAMREIHLTLCAGETRDAELSFEMDAARFLPGRPYAAPSVRVWLMREKRGLCDSVTLCCGRPGKVPRAFIPLNRQDLCAHPQSLAESIAALGVYGVHAPRAVSEAAARALLERGIHLSLPLAPEDEAAARLARFPNVGTGAAPLPAPCSDPAERAVVSAWSLGGMADHPRPADPDALPAELLADLAGWRIDPVSPHVQEVLAWLRAVRVRLTAEAAAQGRYDGPLCDPGEWRQPDIADALRTALSPVHLSALPLYGAWWTLSRFSASLHAAVDEAALPAAVRASGEPLMAHASLEDEEGNVLASFEGACPKDGGPIGTLSAVLPERACALTLHTRITCGGAVVEQSGMPVYVGGRGLLEAAFAGA